MVCEEQVERRIWPGGEEIYSSCWPCTAGKLPWLSWVGGEEEGDSGERNMMNNCYFEQIETVGYSSDIKDTPRSCENANGGKLLEVVSERKDFSKTFLSTAQLHSPIFDQGLKASSLSSSLSFSLSSSLSSSAKIIAKRKTPLMWQPNWDPSG